MNTMKVINVRGRKDLKFGGTDGVIYVGRAVPRAGYQRSRWANPWKVQDFPKVDDYWQSAACVAHYVLMAKHVLGLESSNNYDTKLKSYLEWEMFTESIKTVHLLKGRTLGCWCCDWDGTSEPSKPCHAVVLWKLANMGVESI